ncbi:MAG: hypothetical protein R3F07_04045 [Opitutaceae bacterium]
MPKKVITIWLSSLFALNAVFGAYGGLLLCIHQNLIVHTESGVAGGFRCEAGSNNGLSDFSCLSGSEPCLDVELIGGALPAFRAGEFHSISSVTQVCGIVETAADPVFPLFEVAKAVQLRAPPVVRATSVLVAQVVNLRI